MKAIIKAIDAVVAEPTAAKRLEAVEIIALFSSQDRESCRDGIGPFYEKFIKMATAPKLKHKAWPQLRRQFIQYIR